MTPTFTELPPISDPVVTINGRALTVVYNFMAEFKLSEWGVDAHKAWEVLLSNAAPQRLYYVYNLFAAMVAHNYGRGEVAPTAEDWIRVFGSDITLVEMTSKAVTQALGKQLQAGMREKRAKEAAALPAMTPEASTSAPN